MTRIMNKFRQASLMTQGAIAALCLAFYAVSSYILENSYIASKFPVPYFEQQTSFDALKMKLWYQFMIDQGTFDVYLQTQFIDFIFIAAVILAGFTVWTLLSSLHHEGIFFHKWGFKFAYALPIAGAFDILENLVSFLMIANPQNFADVLLLPYSTFAVIKFGCWTVALVWFLISAVTLIISKLLLFKRVAITSLCLVGITVATFAQSNTEDSPYEQVIYFEADPLAYINKGYSLHLGYENWGIRFDLTKVKVDFPKSFENAFYGTEAFDLVSNITGFKIDYIGNRSNWTKAIFLGLDVNNQKLDFTHREASNTKELSAFNIGLRTGIKINLFKGFYITPWAAVWRNVKSEESFIVDEDIITTNQWDWITTIHFGYAIKI